MMEVFVLHWGNRAAEGELGSNGRVLEYKVRMPSRRCMRQRTDLAVVSIDGSERQEKRESRGSRVPEGAWKRPLCLVGDGGALLSEFFGIVDKELSQQTNGSNIDFLPKHLIPHLRISLYVLTTLPHQHACTTLAQLSASFPSTSFSSPFDVRISFSPVVQSEIVVEELAEHDLSACE
jgi:hypothetical protein